MRNNASSARSVSANSSFSSVLDDNEPGFLDKGRAAGFDRHARKRSFRDRDNQRRSDRLARREERDED